MTREIIRAVSNSKIIRAFAASPCPRWTVFLADLLTIFVSCMLIFYLNAEQSSDVSFTFFGTPLGRSVVLTAIFAVCSLFVKPYQYIIRLSVFEDVYRVMIMTVSSTLLAIVLNFSFEAITGICYFNIWNLVIIGVFAFSMMMMLRLAIKYFYKAISSVDVEKKRVIVLGSALNSFIFASALKTEYEGRFDPVALLSLSPNKNEKLVNGLPVVTYNPHTITETFRKYHCDTLLFLSTQIEIMRDGLADEFLKHRIKLLMLNQIEEFDSNSNSLPAISPHVRDIKIEDLLGRDEIHTNLDNIRRVLEGEVVMITGAAGSIGSEIVNQVARIGAKEIVLLDQAETPMHELQLQLEETFGDNIKIHLFIGDVANPTRVELAFRKYRPRYVFHAAAYKHVPMMERNPAEAVLTNVFGTKNVADLSVKYNVEKFVMISTDKAVNPTNVMGASKRIAEIYVQSLFFHQRKLSDKPTTQFITTRFGNVLGSNGSVIPLFRRQIEEGGPVTVTHRDIIRYFMTIPEACSLVLEAGSMGRGGEIYIFDMGQPVKIYDLARRMISLAGMREGKDIKIVETGLRPGEKLYEELLNDKERTISTNHSKIMIARVRQYEYDEVMAHLDLLYKAMLSGNVHDIVSEMKHIVPEYISQNSVFEKIDHEINNDANGADDSLASKN